eukprot:10023-Heterococcus_DN1.PRE.2
MELEERLNDARERLKRDKEEKQRQTEHEQLMTAAKREIEAVAIAKALAKEQQLLQITAMSQSSMLQVSSTTIVYYYCYYLTATQTAICNGSLPISSRVLSVHTHTLALLYIEWFTSSLAISRRIVAEPFSHAIYAIVIRKQGAGSGASATTTTAYNPQQGFSVYIDYHAASQAYMASIHQQQQQQQQHQQQRKKWTGGISKIRVAYGMYCINYNVILTLDCTCTLIDTDCTACVLFLWFVIVQLRVRILQVYILAQSANTTDSYYLFHMLHVYICTQLEGKMYSTQWVDFKTTLQVAAVSNFNGMNKDTVSATATAGTGNNKNSMVMVGLLESRVNLTGIAANPQARLVLEIQTK